MTSMKVPDGAPAKVRIGSCQYLLRWVIDNAGGWTSDQELSTADLLLLTIFARSTRTFEAIVGRLAEGGFGEQGLMLCRSLWEDMVDAHWVADNPALAVERLELHDRFSRYLRAQTQRTFKKLFEGRDPPPQKVSANELTEMRSLFGKYGTGSWTGVSGHKRLTSILDHWKTDDDRETAEFMGAWVLKLLNETIHPSAFSIGRMGSPIVNNAGNFEYRFGSTPDWLTHALHAALWTYAQTVGLVLELYCPTAKSDLEQHVLSADRGFKQAAHWERTGRLEEPPTDG